MVDGLKVSKRKIVSHALKRNVTSDLKVAQFAASVTEAMAYHYREVSLQDAVV